MVGIPVRTNCAPLLADLFLYSYENEFLDKLIKEGKWQLARKFSLPYCYIDDLISFNNKSNKTNDLMLNLTPENVTQHSRIEWQLHTKEAQHPLKWAKWLVDRSIEM